MLWPRPRTTSTARSCSISPESTQLTSFCRHTTSLRVNARRSPTSGKPIARQNSRARSTVVPDSGGHLVPAQVHRVAQDQARDPVQDLVLGVALDHLRQPPISLSGPSRRRPA